MARRGKDNAIDWDAIERQFRLGTKSKSQLAADFGVEPSSIGRREKKYGWVANKSEEVQATRESLLIQAALGNANPNATPSALEVKAAAQQGADVVMGHRKGLARLGALRDKLLAEIEAITDNRELFEQLGEVLDESGEDANGRFRADKQNEIYRKVISMTERIDSTKKLVEIDEKVRKGEREAFGIDAEGAKGSDIDALLAKIVNSGV
jgi:hypothetical protein